MPAVSAADETHILFHGCEMTPDGFLADPAFICDFSARYFGIRFYAVEDIALHFGKFLRVSHYKFFCKIAREDWVVKFSGGRSEIVRHRRARITAKPLNAPTE